jgi:hypothetical protein
VTRSFDLIKHGTDLVIGLTRYSAPQIARFDSKDWRGSCNATLGQCGPQVLVHNRLESLARPPGFGLKPRRDVVIEGKCSAHIKMLST